jgi:hypothetical protein
VRSDAQAAPGFRDDDRIGGMARIVPDAGGNADPAGAQIEELAQVSHLLGAIVLHARHLVGVVDHLHGVAGRGVDLAHVEHGPIGDAALGADALAAQSLPLFGSFLVGVQPRQCAGRGDHGGAGEDVDVMHGHGSTVRAMGRWWTAPFKFTTKARRVGSPPHI